MLNLFTSFFNRIAIKSIPYLLNSRIVSENEVFYFKGLIVHYLNTSNEEKFLTRNLRYFRDVPENKKIIVTHISDLIRKDDTVTLKNKYLARDIRKWNLANIKQFRNFDFIENGILDENTIHVVNYNTLKDLYTYKSSPLSEYNQFTNLYTTYLHYVKLCLTKFTQNKNIINIKLPMVIPSYFIIDKLLTFNNIKYTRIVKDEHLKLIIELYKWLSNKNRENSIFKNISDKDSENLILEIEYKNYFCFLPLSLIRSISEESELESKLKLNSQKLNRLFIFILLKIQKQIDSLAEQSEEGIENKEKELEKSFIDTIDEEEDLYEKEKTIDISPDSVPEDISSIVKKDKDNDAFKQLKKKSLDDINNFNFNEEIEIKRFINNIEKEFKENNEIDNIFIEDIIKSENTSKTTIDEDVGEKKFYIETDENKIQSLLKEKNEDERFEEFLELNKNFKLLSSNDIRSLKNIKEKRKLLKSPYDEDTYLIDFDIITSEDKAITPEDKKINVKNEIVDKDIQEENIKNLNKKYIEKVMKKDIVSCIRKLEKSDIIIKDYKIEEERSLLGNYENHILTLKPYIGRESTIYFRLPKIDSDGRFYSSGVKLIMRKQKADVPIRKIDPVTVSLLSNYCKLFISRTERKAFNYYRYLVDFIRNDYLNEKNVIKKLQPGNNFDNYKKLPSILSYFSMYFSFFETGQYVIETNYSDAKNRLDENILNEYEKKGYFYFGYKKSSKEPIFIDFNDDLFILSNNTLTPIESINEILKIENEKLPVQFSNIKILGKDIPLGPVLAYYIGLNNLISAIKADVTFIESNKRYEVKPNEFVIKFKDYKMIVNRKNKEAMLLLGGFLFFKDFIKNYNIADFNEKNIYLSLLEYRDYNILHLKELDLLRDLFLDPITQDVLKEISEPHEYIPLLLRANSLLTNFDHPSKNDPNFSRIRGYERIPGLMYRALVESIRDFKFKYNSRSKIELDPYKVWNYITKDNTTKIAEDINPLMDLKEVEAVTLTGIDGISRDAISKDLRRYHENDMGLFSEATVDSSDVAVNTYLTPYVKIKNIRGIIENKEVKNKHEIFSTSTNLSPYALHDDPKRINFINIQNSHVIYAKGYTQPAIRTEYEYLIPYRTSSLFSFVAKDDGEVIYLSESNMRIRYKNLNIEKGFTIGKVYGRAEGTVYEHNLIPNFNLNDKFKKGDIIYYNSNFFEKDWISDSIILKANKLYTVALMMTNEVYEDSSALSARMSKEMSTKIVKEYSFVIEFTKNIINIVSEGTDVEPDTTLFIILDEAADYRNLSENTILLLQNLVNFAPKAKIKGTLERYEVKYNGEISDMSPTLKKFVSKIEKETIERYKGTEYEVTSCKVNSEYRVEGKNLLPDTLELKVFISFEISAAIGDKGVFSTQLKSVISDVFSYRVTGEKTGDEVDAFFSYNSIANRITLSPLITGMLNRLLRIKGKEIALKYLSKK